MQVHSFLDKYDINKKFLEDTLNKIDSKMEALSANVDKMTTSEKNAMLYDIAWKNYTEAIQRPVLNKNLNRYLKELLNIYCKRNGFVWVNDLIKNHNPKTIKNNYRQYLKKDTIESMVKKTFGFNEIPNIIGVDKKYVDFFYYYISYVSGIGDKLDKKVNVKARLYKENAIVMFQNLADISLNLYDLEYQKPFKNEEEIECTWIPLDKEKYESEELYNEAKSKVGLDYLKLFKGVVVYIYDIAFNK